MKVQGVEVAFWVSITVVCYGMYLIYPPLAYIFFGLTLAVSAVIIGGQRHGNSKRPGQ